MVPFASGSALARSAETKLSAVAKAALGLSRLSLLGAFATALAGLEGPRTVALNGAVLLLVTRVTCRAGVFEEPAASSARPTNPQLGKRVCRQGKAIVGLVTPD